MHSHSRRQLILESGCSHQVAVFPLCQCPLFLHLFLLLQLCMASRQTGQKFFWFIFWLQASLHHQLLNVLISLFKLSQAVQAKQKNACLLAGFCLVFASPVYYIVRWSKSMQYEGIIFWEILTFSWKKWSAFESCDSLCFDAKFLELWKKSHEKSYSFYYIS